jgi:hypothetical protein
LTLQVQGSEPWKQPLDSSASLRDTGGTTFLLHPQWRHAAYGPT